jgi:hypothetical protein
MAMSAEAAPAPVAERPPVTADPFGFWPDRASRIRKLGGTDPSDDPAYVFHTPYADIAPGPTRCVLQFAKLRARTGTLVVRVNAIPTGPQPVAETVKAWSLSLSEVAARDATDLPFEAEPGKRYAVLGYIYGETDARAEGLAVRFHSGGGADFHERELAAARSRFGRKVFRRAATLLSDGRATLADPVSQTCTASQFDEPDYDKWTDRLRVAKHRHRKQWEFVYILQALERYGMLRPGARGLGFGVGTEPLPAVMAAMGCRVVATDLAADDARSRDWSRTGQHSAGKAQLRHPEICPDDAFDAAVEYRAVDMNEIPGDLRGFDFTWSSCSYEHLGSIRNGLDFVINSVRCLRPGGLAVHTTELNLVSNEDTIDNEGTVLFRRRDFERLAVDLVSRGNFVAQIKYDLGDAPLDAHVDVPPFADNDHLKLALGRYVSTSFGLIVRRGDV